MQRGAVARSQVTFFVTLYEVCGPPRSPFPHIVNPLAYSQILSYVMENING